jgi:hypothetical protein
MSVKKAISYMMENNLDHMRDEMNKSLTEKAIEKIEERKIEIAQNYFGKK